MELRHDLLAEQVQGGHHALVVDQPAAVDFRQDAVDAELVLQRPQAVGHHLRRADQDLAAQRLVIGQALDALEALGAAFDRAGAGAAQRIPQPLGLLPVKVHQALLGLRARPLLGLGEIGRDPQIYLSSAGMARRSIGFAIFADLRGEFGKRAVAGVDKDRQSALADLRIGIGASGGDPDRGQWLLQRFRRDGDVLDAVVLPLVGDGGLRPGLLDNVENLSKAVSALGV